MLSNVQLNILQEIFIQPSTKVIINRFDQSKSEQDSANCSGSCKSPGGCAMVK